MKVSYEMRLKDSGIEPCQDYPQVLNRAADNVSKNYELHAFVVDSGNKLQSRFLDPAYRLTVGIFNFKQTSATRGTTLISLLNHQLKAASVRWFQAT
ncbi:MAG: hypothetical protein IJ228_03775 [Succinivibrio sp.]|nr:hypothetical protein [Succinivibrio sp.]